MTSTPSKKRRISGPRVALVLIFFSGGLFLLIPSAKATAVLSTDAYVSTHLTNSAPSITSPSFSTTQANELVVAYIGSDGPNSAASQTISAVTGGGLTWSLRTRANAQAGDAEIWQAVAPTTLQNVTVSATLATGSYQASLVIVSYIGAATTASGAVAHQSASTGAPSVSLTTTAADSWVWAVGEDWDNNTARTLGPNQTLQDEYLDQGTGDTYWTQYQTNHSQSSGTTIVTNDVAPTTDRWNMAAIEILPATSSAQPTAPVVTISSGPASLTNSTSASIAFSASNPTDPSGSISYTCSLDTAAYSSCTSPATFNGLSGTNTFSVIATDSTDGLSSAAANTAWAIDTTPPTVSMTSPSSGSVTGTVSVAATATDSVGVSSVQFELDDTDIGPPETTSPYTYSWNSTSVPNGSHTLTAVATDAAGNVATASPVTVTVNNAAATSNTIWPASAVPGTVSSNDSTPVELGLKFQSNVATTVTGVRFYKSTSNTGTHVGSLWTSAGTSLATVTFTNETASGWQQASFSSPVAIAANTTYVIGYHTLTGHYSDDNNYFATSGVASGPLTALSNSAAGGNGVYAYGASVAFPTLSYESTNYWVDVVTSGTSSGGPTPPTVPTNLSATAVNSGLVDLAWTASTDNVGVKGYDIYREGTLIGTSATNSYADSTVAAGTTYSYTVSAYDTVGNVSAQSAPASVTTPASGSTIFSDNFPGTSLSSAWTVIVRHGEYAQGETECNVPGAVAVASNTLSITTTAQSATCGDFNLDGSVRHAPTVWPYTTGDVQWTSFNFTYGTVTYRAKFPAHATGTWPAIWFLGSNCQATNIVTADTGYSTCSQIESPGYEEIDSTECYQTEWCQLALAQPSSFPVCLYPVDTNWHTYSMIWTPTSVSVTIDGQPTGCDFTSAAGYVIPSKPMFMIVQTQTGGSGGTPDNANLPALLQVSDVTVTQP